MYRKLFFGGVTLFLLSPFAVFAATFFHVSDSGDFGFGTDSPLHRIDVVGSIYSRLVSLSDSSTVAVDWNDGNTQTVTLGGNRTLTFSGGQAGGHYTLILKQDGTGNRSVTWPTVTWGGGSEPILSHVANASDVIEFIYDGTDYLGYTLFSSTSGTVIEDFEGYALGSIDMLTGGANWTDAWNLTTGSGGTATVVSSTSYSGAKSLHFHVTEGHDIELTRAFEPMASGTISFAVRKEQYTGSYQFSVNLFGASTYHGVVGIFDDDIRLRDNESDTDIGSFITGQWNKIDVEFNTVSDLYRARINGGVWSSYMTMRSSPASIQKIMIYGERYVSNTDWDGYIDNISVKADL